MGRGETDMRILIVEDEDKMRDLLRKTLEQDGHDVDTAARLSEARGRVAKTGYDLVITDLKLERDMAGLELLKEIKESRPETHVVLITAFATIELGAEAIRLGAYHYLIKPVKLAEIRSIASALSGKGPGRVVPVAAADERLVFDDIVVGKNPKMQKVYELIPRIVEGTTTVLIRGESGTGKEVIARAVHDHGPRRGKPFVDVNCAALVDTLLEAELFGIEKRVATGVDAREGKLEQASGGTLFLDEIGDMSLVVQSKVLRVLQEKRIVRVGGRDKIDVDVRIIAATNADLEKAVRERRFREDLYYRLSVVTVEIPPLRERPEDLPAFVAYFIERLNKTARRRIRGVTEEVMDLFRRYSWPGNIRELENTLERAALFVKGDSIGIEDLPERLVAQPQSRGSFALPSEGIVLEDVERDLIVQALERTGWKKAAAARLLGLTRRALGYRVEKFGLAAPGSAAGDADEPDDEEDGAESADGSARGEGRRARAEEDDAFDG
jgi:DNA-binding NtrC family response regulator